MAVLDKEQIENIIVMLKNLEYGSLVITIHAGYITQMDRTEKNRFATQKSVNK
ncbi:YezD family protein [Bacillus sp. UNC41MFS5]|uniref:YezD family protein n=1 Tax=Bacillus sp. UNC41MFS5 TaxID=1449046 RepID=UPI0009DE6AD1|nr:YezD family protein [Bacillus sp. UNC41MFS5]